MKGIKYKLATIFALMITPLYGVTTGYITDFNFEAISGYQLSNISLLESGGIELSRQYMELYHSEQIAWSVAVMGNSILIGSGDYARLIKIDGSTSTELYTDKHLLFFSDIEIVNEQILVAGLPPAKVIILDKKNFTKTREIEFTNSYIWDIVPFGDGYYALTGDPAQLYYVSDRSVEWLMDALWEGNLLKGLVINDTLYFAGENHLYKLSKGKIIAIAAFDNIIADFEYVGGKIYLITSSKALYVPSKAGEGKKVEKNKKNNGGDPYAISSLYRIDLDGTVQKLFERSGVKFISIAELDGNLIIGTDKNGGYYEVGIKGDSKKFTSLGSGKFVRMMTVGDKVYAVMIYPTRVLEIEKTYARQGVFISDVFDTKVLSSWGKPIIEQKLLPGTEIEYYTMSGAVPDQDLWEGWLPVKSKVMSSPNRYIVYKVVMTSQGKYTPFVKEINIPYLEKNLPPVIKQIEYKYNNAYLTINWEAEDDNDDLLEYEIYISDGVKDWVKLNTKPLQTTSYNIYYHSFPSGKYRLKLMAHDSSSNPTGGALTNILFGDDFYIDNQAPKMSPIKTVIQRGNVVFTFNVVDNILPIKEAHYSINGGDWIKFSPVDGICDDLNEEFRLSLQLDTPTYVQFKVSDLLGNIVSDGVYVK